MTKVFEGQEFVGHYDRNSGRIFEDLVFLRCLFSSCRLSMTVSPYLRSTARNVQVIDCEQNGSALEAAIIEDVMVENFKTGRIFYIWGAVFRHVVLRGHMGTMLLSPILKTGVAPLGVQHAFDVANAEYYRGVDWALDISEAEFLEADIRGVPARLIRRDPETQVVITRQKARQGGWRDLDLSDTYWATSIDGLLSSEDEDCVLVAPKLHRRFRKLLAGLELLRKAGVAEPD